MVLARGTLSWSSRRQRSVARGSGDGGPCQSDAGVFTQATRHGGVAILRAVLRAAGPLEQRDVLELFAGSGHLTIPLLAQGARVTAVEGAGRAIEYLRANTHGARGRCTVRHAFIDARTDLPPAVDVLVADPPRTGIPDLGAILQRVRATILVLVSCDPATGARDLARARAAGFALEWLQPIDAFPRTSHVEWVARLVREGAPGP